MLGALAGSAHVALTTDLGGFRRDMTAAERQFLTSTGRMQRESARTGQAIRRGFAIGAGVVGAVAPIYLLQRALRSAWEEMQDAQRVGAQTDAVLASTGGAANVTREHIEELANALLRLSGVDDQVIQSGANVLATFTQIRNEVGAGNDIFDQATRAALDLSVALGQDMQSSAIQLGKALNDPIRGVTALQRVGVSFTAGQREQIRALIESGKTLEAQKLILAELRVEFGGSAKAAGETFPAALDRLRNTAASAAATYLQALVPALEEGADWLQRQVEAFADNEEAQEEFRKQVEEVVETIRGLAGFADDVSQALGGWANVIEILIALKFARLILDWTVAIKAYRNATLGAAAATTALGIAQGGLLGGGARGLTRGALGRLALPAALAGTAGAVAIGSAVVLSQTPGASGAKEGDRRSRMRALYDGEFGDEFPDLTNAYYRATIGQATPKELALIKTLGQATEAEMRRVDRALRRLNARAGAGSNDRGRGGRGSPQRGTGARPRTTLIPPTVELSTGTELALAQAERTESTLDDLRALHRAEAELNRLLKQKGLTDEERLDLVKAIGSIESQIRSLEESNARDAERARDERTRAREEATDRRREAVLETHERRVFELERRADRAAESQGINDDIRALIALRNYYRRWRDAQKRGSQDWRDAQADLDAVKDSIVAVRQGERQNRQGLKLWRLERRVRLAEETEGVTDDLKALSRLRAHLLSSRNAYKRYSEDWRATQDQIDEINSRIRQAKRQSRSSADLSGNFKSLEAELRGALEEFAPNFFPDGGGLPGAVASEKAGSARDRFGGRRGGVTIVQEFPNAPTDYHKEARYAVNAARAAFDG